LAKWYFFVLLARFSVSIIKIGSGQDMAKLVLPTLVSPNTSTSMPTFSSEMGWGFDKMSSKTFPSIFVEEDIAGLFGCGCSC